MTKQSEHLSSAQIENYGIRNSGAGPETAQRDVPQRADHPGIDDQRINDRPINDRQISDQGIDRRQIDDRQIKDQQTKGRQIDDLKTNDQQIDDLKMNDQRVEAHLADCASCRNRLLEFHRAHFTPLAETADSPLRTASTPDCPSDDDLRQLAAGLSVDNAAAGDALATKLLQHAATCDHCGRLLKTFTEDFSDDFSPEEQAALANLQSSSAAWQKKTARQMLQAAGTTAAKTSADAAEASAIDKQSSQLKAAEEPAATAPDRKPFFWKWALIPATAAIVAVAVSSIWYAQRDTPEKVDTLLAQVYTDKRTTEMRLPNAKHADFVQTRSGESESRLNSPPSLSRAAEQISEHLKKDPDDPKWLILSARLDLLDWNYKPALSSLEKINDAHVAESPEFLMTRAFALYEKSEVLKENQGYFEAVNLLAKALQKTPDDPVLLFNRAIACERILAYECAIGDWNRFLTIEKDPGWTSEARKHLQQIEEKKTLAP